MPLSRLLTELTVLDETRAEMASDPLRSQATRLIFASAFRAECHVAAGRFFGNVHLVLGAVAAGLAAGAGATAFASNNVVAGCLAIAAAAITGLLTSLRPDERSQLHWNAANGFADLANRTYMAFLFGRVPEDIPSTPAEPATQNMNAEQVGAIEAFQREFRRLDAAAPPLPGRLTKKGQKAIAERRTWHPPQFEDFTTWRTAIETSRPSRLGSWRT